MPGHSLPGIIEALPLTGSPAVVAQTYLANPACPATGLKPPCWYLAHMLAARDLLNARSVAGQDQMETAE